MNDATIAIISIGGNVIIKGSGGGASGTMPGSIEDQRSNIRAAVAHVAAIAAGGAPVIITHGNGPIIGNILIRSECAKDEIPPMPLYISDADSEGGIGFMLQQALHNELIRVGCKREVAAIVTQVVVDPKDPAFDNPTKPIGPYYSEEQAAALATERGYAVAEVTGRGWRRVVPCPAPIKVVEAEVIKKLSLGGTVTIACGGGGVPVTEDNDGTLTGIDAVIDKDMTTTTLALAVGARSILNLTEVGTVYLNFGKASQEPIKEININEAKKYLDAGEFAPGSMGPKVKAAIMFIEGGGEEIIITSPEKAEEALKGRAGTRIHA